MSQNDRTTGLVGNAGMKVPVKAATTANITLSGEQTIDGIACVTGDRVLVKDQTTGANNGIYVVDTGAWSRAPDFDGSYDIVSGSLIRVNQGSTNSAALFAVSTADPITIGTTSLSFSRTNVNFVTRSSSTASAGQTVINVGATFPLSSNGIAVFINGLRQRVGDDFTETTSDTITMTYPLQAGDEIDCYISEAQGNLSAALASLVAITDAGDYYVNATVEAVLQEIATNIAADNGDASATFTNGSSARVQRWNTALTANRTLTLSASNAKAGAKVLAVRGAGATGNFTLSVGSLATLRAPGEWALCVYSGSLAAWVLVGYGILPSADVLAMSADKGDADATLTVGTSERTARWSTTLTADRTCTLALTPVWQGARFTIFRGELATGNFALSVVANSLRLARLAPGEWCTVEWNGTAWTLTGSGRVKPGLSPMIELQDDFLGEEIDGYKWQSLIGSDAECRQAAVVQDEVGGVVRIVTGDDAGATMAINGTQLQSALNWRATQGGLSWEARVALSAITNVALFVGFTDQVDALEMPFTLAAGDALTSNASDAVGVLFDTAADTDNWWLVGVAADVDASKQNTAVAPVAGIFETWRIEISATGVATFYRNGTLIGNAMSGAVTPGTKLTPVFAAFSRAAASRDVDIDGVHIQAQR